MNEKVKIGALIWPQFTEWASMRSMAVTADRVGYDNLWTWDHVYPIIGNPNGQSLKAGPHSSPGPKPPRTCASA